MNPGLWILVVVAWGIAVGIAILIVGLRATGERPILSDDGSAELLAAGLLPLVDCPRDRDACLRCIQVDHCVVHRLLELGLTPGTSIRIVQDAGGPMLVSVRGSRVALGRDLAEKVWVELSNPVTEIFPAHHNTP